MKTFISNSLMVLIPVLIALNIQAYYYNQELKRQKLLLTKERDIWYDNYRMMQETRYEPLYEDKYVQKKMKRSTKYRTIKWRG